MRDAKIPALTPNGPGCQFVVYGDSCSGVPGALHAQMLARINAVLQRLDPPPEFVIFPGDEIIGLTPDENDLRAQWQHFLETEMRWVRQAGLPMYHCTGNHTTYDAMSDRVFADVLSHLPRNGPADQQGLSYFVRNGDVLLVFVNTLNRTLGGEGHLDLDWLRATLADHRDAKWTFVVGHHPAFPVNGFAGPYQRTIGDEYVPAFWNILSDHGVMAYLCSHILAFDVQCHDGVLQITTAGAGTAHRMPEGVEYLHAVQMAVDRDGLRYQVLDQNGVSRETLLWPPALPAHQTALAPGRAPSPLAGKRGGDVVAHLSLRGTVAGDSTEQTILSAEDDAGTRPLWIGLLGRQRQLTILLQPIAGRSPHRWLGPCFAKGDPLDMDLLLHGGMGPGGLLWRRAGSPEWTEWTGLRGASAQGLERLIWPQALCLGGTGETAFQGALSATIGWIDPSAPS